MIKRVLKFALIFTLVCVQGLFAADKYSPWTITGGVGLNYNMHSSNFKNMPGSEDFFTTFESANGLGLNAQIGGMFTPSDKWLGMNMHLQLLAVYSDLNGKYDPVGKIANYIDGNDVYDLLIKNNLDANIAVFGLQPAIIFNPMEDLPLGIKLGLQVGFPISKSYDLEGEIVQPSDITFDDGSKSVGAASGDIENLASSYMGVVLGARYEITKFGDFTLNGEAEFVYGISKIQNDLDWSINSLRAGVAIDYRIKRDLGPRAIDAPMPPMPESPVPPRKKELAVDLELKHNGRSLENKETIEAEVEITRYVNKYKVLPLLFFAEGNGHLQSASTDNIIESSNNLMYDAIAKWAKKSDDPIVLFVSVTSKEGEEVANSRLAKVKKKLVGMGIDEKRIGEKKFIKDVSELKYEVLQEEYQGLYFELGRDTLVEIEIVKDIRRVKPVKVTVEPQIRHEKQEFMFNGNITLNRKEYAMFGQYGTEVELGEDQLKGIENGKNYKLRFYTVVDDKETRDDADYTIEIKGKNVVTEELQNLTEHSNNNVKEYVLGYCRFDKSSFYSVDRSVIDIAREAQKDGKKIEILALTDNLGDPDYNKNLANSRARTALRYLGKGFTKEMIKRPDGFMFSNDNPYGRMLNRSVIVRIID